MSGTPLEHLRVVDCSGWSGAYAAKLLADAGSDVIRVVPPSGDPLKSEPPFFGASAVSIQDAWYNAGKRVRTLDFGRAADREAFLQLVSEADILLAEWSGSEAPFARAELELANPRLAHVAISPMGATGPWAALHTNDLIANALSGAASVTGDASTPPLTGYGNQTYHTVGVYAAICALSAVRAARATDRAYQFVDLSAHEALVSCTEQVLMQWFFPEGTWKQPIAPRQGSLHWSRAYEVYPARDGLGVMVTAALRFADVLLPWLKEEGAAQDLADESKYPNIISIIRDLPYVMRVLREWVAGHEGDELFFEAQRRHEPFGVVWDVARAAVTPQTEARRYWQSVDIPGTGMVPFPGRLFRTDADGPPPAAPHGVVRIEPRPARPTVPVPAKATAGAPLAGVRVLDFTHVLAGPFGTRVLGDLGADIIKITAAARGGGANTPDHPYYIMWNRNKRNVSLNMATEGGRRIARQLAEKSDVIIENFSAGVLRRWGLDRPGLRDANPGVTVISMGGMSQEGPWSNFVTFAPTIHALTGLTYLTNPPGRHDLGYGFSLTDHLSGLAGALAALEGIEHRDRTGEGLEIDLAQYELGLGLMAPALIDYRVNGMNPEPVGNRHPFDAWAPHGIYRCAGDDRWVAIAARGDAQWSELCSVLGQPALASDSRFATHAARIANAEALDAVIEVWTRTRDRYEVMAACQSARVPAGAVQDARDLLENDPQLASRAFFRATESPPWGDHGVDRFPATFNGERPAAEERVHQTGEDTFDVLTQVLDLSDEDIAELMSEGALT